MGQSVNLIEYIDELIGDDYVSYSELLEVQEAIEYINEDGYENINGRITWSDNSNVDGNRPLSVTIKCYDNSTLIQSTTTNSDNDWEYSFSNLPSFDSEHEGINYTLTVDSVADYTPVITGYDIEMGYTRNTQNLTVGIIWDDNDDEKGLRPNSVTATLSDNSTVVLNEANEWSGAVTVPVRLNNTVIDYEWTIPSLGMYSSSVVIDGNNTVFTNLMAYYIMSERNTYTPNTGNRVARTIDDNLILSLPSQWELNCTLKLDNYHSFYLGSKASMNDRRDCIGLGVSGGNYGVYTNNGSSLSIYNSNDVSTYKNANNVKIQYDNGTVMYYVNNILYGNTSIDLSNYDDLTLYWSSLSNMTSWVENLIIK